MSDCETRLLCPSLSLKVCSDWLPWWLRQQRIYLQRRRPRLGRSPGEGIGYPLQYSWGSLVAQMVKNPPATQETWVRSLGWEDPLEKGKATYASILA